MVTIKSYTDLKQSKKLAEILPFESADMYYDRYEDPYFINVSVTHERIKNDKYHHLIPCWSLSASLDVLPEGTRLLKATNISSVCDTKYHCDCPKSNIDVWFDNPIDACVAMIEKLNELKML